MIAECPIFLKYEADNHSDKECQDGAREVRHTEHIQCVKYAEVHTETDDTGNEEFQNAHGTRKYEE